MEDNGIIELYFARDESAIRMTDEKYGHYCFTVAWNILFDREDCDECVSDTYRKTWELIPPQRPSKLNMLRMKTRDKRGGGEYDLALGELERTLSTGSTPEEDLNAHELAAALNRFLSRQKERDRNVFVRRYFYMESAKTIADKYGLTESNVNVILKRTRDSLKEHLTKEGYL